MIDTLLSNMSNFIKPKFFNELNLDKTEYFVLTLHRPGNVDDRNNFLDVLGRLSLAARSLPIIFPAHPRLSKIIQSIGALPPNIYVVEAQPYLEFNYLVKYSKAVITDSGGVTEEATVLNIPCMTMRDTTERLETIDIGTNQLIGSDLLGLEVAMEVLFKKQWRRGRIPPLWDGKSGERIAMCLENLI